MELELLRFELSGHSTIGKLYHGNELICYTLEDKDRGLKQDWELATIIAYKIPHETAIPLGRYEVTITQSERFKRALPLLLNVKGFEGIRIHPGNTSADTDGCILVGEYDKEDFILKSRKTFERVFDFIGKALLNEKVFITITRI